MHLKDLLTELTATYDLLAQDADLPLTASRGTDGLENDVSIDAFIHPIGSAFCYVQYILYVPNFDRKE